MYDFDVHCENFNHAERVRLGRLLYHQKHAVSSIYKRRGIVVPRNVTAVVSSNVFDNGSDFLVCLIAIDVMPRKFYR